MTSLLNRIDSVRSRTELMVVLDDLDANSSSFNVVSSLLDREWASVVNALIRRFEPSFIGLLTKKEFDRLANVFLSAPFLETLMALNCALLEPTSDYQLSKVVLMLDRLISRKIAGFLCRLCEPAVAVSLHSMFAETCQLLVALPDRMSNVMRTSDSESTFSKHRYSRLMAIALKQAVDVSCARLSANQDASLEFCAQLLSKLCLAGYGRSIMALLIPHLNARLVTDGDLKYIVSRVCTRLLTDERLGSRMIERLLSDALPFCRRDSVSLLLGDNNEIVAPNSALKHLLCHKFLLGGRHFPATAEIPEKVATYLSEGTQRRPLLGDTLLSLLDAWADESAMLRTDSSRRLNLCASILTFVRYLNDSDVSRIQLDVTERMLRGMQVHLECAEHAKRTQGMFVGECLARRFQPLSSGDGSSPLAFDLPPTDPIVITLQSVYTGSHSDADVEDDNQLLLLTEDVQQEDTVEAQIRSDVVYDSDDDDLVPYDIPESEKVWTTDGNSTAAAPVYIRECLEALYTPDDNQPAVWEASFRALSTLVRRRAIGFDDIFDRLLRKLLILDDRFSTPDFDRIQHETMVACCVQRPRDGARLLIGELYAADYTIGQRMLILDVLCDSVKELSSNIGGTETKQSTAVELRPTEGLPLWRQVVDERIAKKTRLITTVKNSKDEENKRTAVENKFAILAPDFFYPLISNYSHTSLPQLDLRGRDYIVLGRLLFVLGTVLHSARYSAGALSMAQALHNTIWPLRFHKQGHVRQGVIYCYAMISHALPSKLLVTDLESMLSGDMKEWLNYVLEHDSDDECKKLAMQLTALLRRAVSDVFDSGAP